MRKLLHVTRWIRMNYQLTSFDFGADYRSCVVWDMKVVWSSENRGPFTLDYDYTARSGCIGAHKYPKSAKGRRHGTGTSASSSG